MPNRIWSICAGACESVSIEIITPRVLRHADVQILQVEPLPRAIQLQRRVRLRGLLDDFLHVEVHRLALVDEPGRRVAMMVT